MLLSIRTSSVFIGIVFAVVFGMSALTALAVAPADFGLTEGDVISAHTTANDPDVYIVNEHGFKRLFVNPEIFNLYGHLGFNKVRSISPTGRDAFVTSGLFRNCESGDERVYGLDVISEDVANLRWVNTTGEQATADDPDFFKKVFCINNNEQALYGVGPAFTSVKDVPDYSRFGAVPSPTVTPTPTPTPPVTIEEPGDTASIVVRDSDDDLGGRVIVVDTSNDTNEVELYRFTIEEQAGVDIWIESLEVTIAIESDAVELDKVIERSRIKDDVEQYGNTQDAKSAELVLFDGIDIHVSGGESMDFFVEVDLRGNLAGSRYAEGEELVVTVEINEVIDGNGNEMEDLEIDHDAVSDILVLRSEDTI